MITLDTATAIKNDGGIVWFADIDGEIVCGHIVTIAGVKEPPNTYVVNMNHIKTSPASPTMKKWSAMRELVDLYPSYDMATRGQKARLRIKYASELKSVDHLVAFVLKHDIQNDLIARRAVINAAKRFHVDGMIPDKEFDIL